jgi:serine/threonine protein phosphatase PrpC
MAGCTALVCLVTKDKIYIANAGDSKAIAYVSK